jgi:hypothetical protein
MCVCVRRYYMRRVKDEEILGWDDGTYCPSLEMSGSTHTHCRALFQSALQTYEKKTGITLAQHPLTLQLQNCRSSESIASFLQDQILPSTDFGGSDRLMGSIRRTISILHNLGAVATFAWASDMVYEIKALMA